MHDNSTDSLPSMNSDMLDDLISLDELAGAALACCSAAPASAPGSALTDSPTARCWGHIISNHRTTCTPGFTPRTGHFKNKFCPSCRATGFTVDPARCAILTEGVGTEFVNPSSKGCWAEKEGLLYRVMNQTAKCKGAPILLARDVTDAASLGLQPVPESFMLNPGQGLHISVANGTLVPTKHLPTRRDAHFIAGAGAASGATLKEDSSGSNSDVKSDAGSEHSNKRSRTSPVADQYPTTVSSPTAQYHHVTTTSTCAGGGGDALAELTASNDSMSNQLQNALNASANDPNLQAYHEALRQVIGPLAAASQALQRASAAASVPASTTTEAPMMMMMAVPPAHHSLSFEGVPGGLPPLVPVPPECASMDSFESSKGAESKEEETMQMQQVTTAGWNDAEELEAPVWRGGASERAIHGRGGCYNIPPFNPRLNKRVVAPRPLIKESSGLKENSLAARLERKMTLMENKAANKPSASAWYYGFIEMLYTLFVFMASRLANKSVALLKQVPTAEGYLVVVS